MRRYRLEIDNVRSHLRSLWIVIGLQGMIILALWIGWSQAPKQLRVYVPPDLRSGAVLAAEEVPPPMSMPLRSISFSNSIAGQKTAQRITAAQFFGPRPT